MVARSTPELRRARVLYIGRNLSKSVDCAGGALIAATPEDEKRGLRRGRTELSGQVLELRFAGEYRAGSEGNPDAAAMKELVITQLARTEPDVVLLDLSRLRYGWGDAILRVFEVYSRVKMCADYHCDESGGEARKYRALMWRTLEDGRTQRRTLSFEVINESDEDGSGGGDSVSMETLRKQSDTWQALCSELRQMATMAIEFSNRSVDRVLEQARQDSERIKPLTELTSEMLSHYHEGLRMQATAVKEVGEMRVKQQLAEAGAKDDKFWEVVAPAVQVALAQAQSRLMGGKAPAKALPSPKPAAPKIERKEHKPPSNPTALESAPEPTPEVPDSIVGLSHMVLDNLGARTLVRLSRMLDDDQIEHLESLSSATDDDTAAQAIVGLSQALMSSPEGLVKMQGLLTVHGAAGHRVPAARRAGDAAPRDGRAECERRRAPGVGLRSTRRGWGESLPLVSLGPPRSARDRLAPQQNTGVIAERVGEAGDVVDRRGLLPAQDGPDVAARDPG